MERLTVTPFGRRPVTAGLMEQAAQAGARPALPHFSKWELFRELCAARCAFGLTDRDLTVLNALLTFHKGDSLSDNESLIVFPSNASLSERAHGMAESTLRRHLAALVHAGMIARHDSPNGKRYAARGQDGEIIRAFGFDLRALLVRGDQILSAAREARAAAARLKALREAVSLLKRDALKLALYGREEGYPGAWDEFEAELLSIHKQMRRKLPAEDLEGLVGLLRGLLDRIRECLCESEEMSGKDSQNGRHYQSSNTDNYESEYAKENGEAAVVASCPTLSSEEPEVPSPSIDRPNLPLGLVLKACPDILDYASHEVSHWHELVGLAGFVRGMMGISPDAWGEAQRIMGPEVAAITVAGILQRISEIRSPGGYLRALTSKAAAGGFSPGPMIMALLSPAGQC